MKKISFSNFSYFENIPNRDIHLIIYHKCIFGIEQTILGYSFNNVPYQSILYQLVTCLFKPWKIYGEGGTHYFFLNMIGDIPRNILSPSKKPPSKKPPQLEVHLDVRISRIRGCIIPTQRVREHFSEIWYDDLEGAKNEAMDFLKALFE